LNRTAFSDTIVMQVHALPTSMGIVASATTICSGDSVTFTASPVLNGGDSAVFQWQVDGQNTGQDLSTFITKSLSNGDQVSCILTSSLGCTAPAASLDTIVMTVNPTPVVTLVADTIITRGSSVQLDPSVTGTIVSWQWTPVAGVNDPSVAKPVATPVNTTTYQLTVSSDKGCVASGDIKIIVYTPLRMPNAFTPGAGHNALFRIPPSLSITLIGFSVFNRAGLEVFTTADAGAGWDGMFGGKPQPTGTYIWEIGYEDLLTGRPARATGTVELIR
jgi:gliding motility-associated-like protein